MLCSIGLHLLIIFYFVYLLLNYYVNDRGIQVVHIKPVLPQEVYNLVHNTNLNRLFAHFNNAISANKFQIWRYSSMSYHPSSEFPLINTFPRSFLLYKWPSQLHCSLLDCESQFGPGMYEDARPIDISDAQVLLVLVQNNYVFTRANIRVVILDKTKGIIKAFTIQSESHQKNWIPLRIAESSVTIQTVPPQTVGQKGQLFQLDTTSVLTKLHYNSHIGFSEWRNSTNYVQLNDFQIGFVHRKKLYMLRNRWFPEYEYAIQMLDTYGTLVHQSSTFSMELDHYEIKQYPYFVFCMSLQLEGTNSYVLTYGITDTYVAKSIVTKSYLEGICNTKSIRQMILVPIIGNL